MATAPDLLKRFNDLKTLPHVALRLSKLISDENSSMQKFEEIIKMDPTLVVRILRVVNSPYYGLQQRVDSISRAVMFIGMRNLRNMVVTEALKDIFKLGQDDEKFSRTKLWLHSAAVGICSQMISERVFTKKGEDAYLCGILHDIGLMVEDQTAHKKFMEVWESYRDGQSIIDVENKIIGTNHCEIAFLLGKDWNLPEEVRQGFRNHHSLMANVDPRSLSGIVQTAEYFVSQMGFPLTPGMKGTLSQPLADHIRENIHEYKAIVRDLPEEMAKARDLYENIEV